MGERVVIDIELIDLIPKYIENRFIDIESCRTFLKNDNYADISSIGHKIKGNARTYGFIRLEEIGKILEISSETKDKITIEHTLDEFFDYLKSIEIEYEQV